MKSRRDILKMGLATTVGLCLNEPLSSIGKETCQGSQIIAPKDSVFAWRQTIFCQFEHRGLTAALNKCERELGCRCWYAPKGDSTDYLAFRSFIHIIDRKFMGLDVWNAYIFYNDSFYDDTPCLIVDNIKNLPIPGSKYIIQFDLNQNGSILDIIQIIKDMRTQMEKNLPEHFKRVKLPSVQKTEPTYSESLGWGTKIYWDWG